ncbi:hypothetical protein Pogu_2123 [Pyrobaculum oguniense TE7]|uniref:Uncharacterized protein n=1 Tax=Pyrobaculum oguniense (strain DSM 13380 / JCM 10595 / TE7) TaxID=698757 RepID=H6QCV4_PYROT|nr:hypothetical protein Pogu_2123 [Pyrobaculum oguniense TE7]
MTGFKICEEDTIEEPEVEVIEVIILDAKYREVKPQQEELLTKRVCYDKNIIPEYCDRYPTDFHCLAAEEEESEIVCEEKNVGKCWIFPIRNGWLIEVVYSEYEDARWIEVWKIKNGELDDDAIFTGYVADIKSGKAEKELERLPKKLQEIVKAVAAKYRW